MTILVTGASGFPGRRLVHALLSGSCGPAPTLIVVANVPACESPIRQQFMVGV